ncbi:RNA polymerase sigma factor [candidate division KSB1 bacterium]|nr:RNA polymerase sigma factor [candidate division KSB1 bacterium]
MELHQVIQKYQRPMVAIACRMLGNLEEAKDAVQEAFIRFWKSDTQIKGDPFSLLCRILINHCIDKLRKQTFRRFFSITEIKDLDIMKSNENPHKSLENKQLVDHVEKLTTRLKPVQKAVFILRDMQGYSIQEISDLTGFPENNIRVNLHLARKNMRKWLQPILKED